MRKNRRPKPNFKVSISLDDSSFIRSVRYCPKSEILELILESGRYRYYDVTPSVFGLFMAAKSAGEFYNAEIKGKYVSKYMPPAYNGSWDDNALYDSWNY